MSHRLPLKLSLLAIGIVSACSLTVPSEDDVFGEAQGGSAGMSAAGSFGNAPVGGDAPDGGVGNAANGGTSGSVAGGGQAPTSGTGPGAGGTDGGAPQGGAGGEPTEPEPEPTGELVNPSFEDSLVGWTVEPATAGIFVQYGEGSGAPVQAVDGKWVLSGWSKADPQKPYAARIYQVIKGVEDGSYKLTVHIASIAGIPKASLYASNCGGTDPEPAPSISSSWTELVIEPIVVSGGECEVGVDIDAKATDWVNVDKFTWEKLETE